MIENSAFISLVIGFVLSLCIYSYLLGDNPLYRLAIHILVGASAGYGIVVAVSQILLPAVNQLLTPPSDAVIFPLLWIIPILLGVGLLLKLFPQISWVGNSSLAAMMGIGVAVALTGAIMGTILPQILLARMPLTSIPLDTWQRGIGNFISSFLTSCTLLYFYFTAGTKRRDGVIVQPKWQKWLGGYIGKGVMMITFGTLLGMLFSSGISLLIAHVDFLIMIFESQN